MHRLSHKTSFKLHLVDVIDKEINLLSDLNASKNNIELFAKIFRLHKNIFQIFGGIST